jgi:hypothetical protein
VISILGLAADDDDDGNTADGNHVEDDGPRSEQRTVPPDPPKDNGPKRFVLPEDPERRRIPAVLGNELVRVLGRDGASKFYADYLGHKGSLRDATPEELEADWDKLMSHPEYGSEVGF